MKSLLKKAVYRGLYASGIIAMAQAFNRSRFAVLMYHGLDKSSKPAHIPPADFEIHLAYLNRCCHVLSLTEIIDSITTGKDEGLPVVWTTVDLI